MQPDLQLLADALDYPGAGWPQILARCRAASEGGSALGPAAPPLAAFASAAGAIPQGQLEELYTASFDMQPEMSLNTGFHLFGDDYLRSAFLAKLVEIYQQRGFAGGTELPDHACQLLRFLARAGEEPEAAASTEGLAQDCLAPALARVAARLEAARHPYADLLRAILALLPAPSSDLDQPAEILPVLP